MKRILIAACALALLMAGCTPALAAEASESQEPVKSCYYPIAVDSYTSGPFDELRISKTYQELLCKGWSHHLIHMTAVHLWQNVRCSCKKGGENAKSKRFRQLRATFCCK